MTTSAGPIWIYSQLAKQVSPLMVNAPFATTGVSGDGSLLLVGNSQAGPVRRYVSNPRRLIDVLLQSPALQIAIDRSGSRVAVMRSVGNVFVYNGSFGFLDTLPATTRAFALAPSTAMAYTLDANGPTISVRRFNVATGPITEVMPALALPSNPDTSASASIHMKVAHDEGALFIASPTGIAVVKLN